MTLPKIDYPLLSITIPSTNTKTPFRPFLVKEEKILLMAKTSEQYDDIMLAVKQVINNCCLNQKVNVDQLTIFDLEYIFIKLRAASVSNMVSVSYKDLEDGKVYDFDIDLNTIDVQWPDNKIDMNIAVTDTAGLVLHYPHADLFDDKKVRDSTDDTFIKVVARCIDKIYDGDSVYPSKQYKVEELEEWITNLPLGSYNKIREFFDNQPKILYRIDYENSKGTKRKIELSTITDFFILG